MSIYLASHFLTGQKSAIKNNFIVRSSDLKKLQNGVLDDFGVIKRRPGSTKVGNTLANSAILGQHDFGKNDGTHKNVVVNAAKLYWNNSGTFTDSGVTGLTTGKRTRFANFINRLFFVNGTQAVKDWDGATTYDNQVASAPTADYICVFFDRIYTNDTTYPSRINYSSIPTALAITWTGTDTGYYEAQTDDGDFVTGIHPRRDRLLIFKNHYIEGRDSYFRRISVIKNLGTPCGDTVVTIGANTYFFNFDNVTSTGVYKYSTSEPVKISNPIQDLIDDITITDPKTQFFAEKDGDNYLLHIGTTQGMNNVVVCYNTLHQAWSYWTLSSTLKVLGTYNDTNVILPYYGTDGGRIYKMTGATEAYYSTTDTTKNIHFILQTHPLICGVPYKFKDFTNVYVFDESPARSQLRYQIDRNEWETHTRSIDSLVSTFDIMGKGYDIGIEISDNSALSPQIKGLAVEYLTEDDAR